MRLFVAVELPQEVTSELMRVQQRLEQSNLFQGTPVYEQNMHITLSFIGDVDEKEVEHIVHALRTIRYSATHALLKGISFGELHGKIRIIFAVTNSPQLVELAHHVKDVVSTWAEPDDHPFMPHVTLFRVKKVYQEEKLRALIEDSTVEPLTFSIHSFSLQQSVLERDGPTYTTLAKIGLT